MKKEHIRNAIIIGASTFAVVGVAYLFLPDKYKEVVSKKAKDVKDKVVNTASGIFKKKKDTENKADEKKTEQIMIGNTQSTIIIPEKKDEPSGQ